MQGVVMLERETLVPFSQSRRNGYCVCALLAGTV